MPCQGIGNTLLTANLYRLRRYNRRVCFQAYCLTVASGPSDISGVSDADLEMQRLIDSQVESHKIGSAIADEALRRSSPVFSPELPTELLQDAVFDQQVCDENIFVNKSPY